MDRSEEFKLLASTFNAHQPIAILDRNGTFIKVNAAFCNLSGYSALQLKGANVRLLRSDRHNDQFYHEFWLALYEHGYWQGELWNKLKSGEIRLHVNISAVTDEQGHFTHYVAFYEDESVRYQQQLLLEQKAAQETSLSILMAYCLDELPMTAFLNQCMEQIRQNHQWHWKLLSLYQLTHSELHSILSHGACVQNNCEKSAMTQSLCRSVIQQGAPKELPLDALGLSSCLIEKDHALYAVPLNQNQKASVLVLYLPKFVIDNHESRAFLHRVVHVLGMGINKRISDQALEDARKRAELSSKAKSQLLSSVSHELRTPLNAILGFSQLLQDEGLNEIQLEYSQEIHAAGKHLLNLVNDILDLARMEQGRVKLNVEALSLSASLSETLAMVQQLALEKNVCIEFSDKARILPEVNADPIRLKQVLLNLLSNAIKYNEVNGQVRLHLKSIANQKIRLEIEDSGQGVPEDKEQLLFQAFNRLGAEQGPTEGTGIGLAICKRLIKLMHGEIGYQRHPVKGSIFWIELPFAHYAQEISAKTSRAHFNILCLDDDPIHLRLIEGLLSQHPELKLFTETNASYALEFALKQPVDLILLDLHMPELSGYEVLEILKASPRTATIPVVAISAENNPEQINQCLLSGFTEYLTKPLSVDKLLVVVEQLQQEQKQLLQHQD
ncbi:hypothetical protein BTE48_13620 [Oceanospirillum multiglobuliferum]|uniref:histidine kinase n=2 Tax=Oceanospirillum multiglobuliferum TaxID=64969 RepID=A0A1V4T1P6_9GAMM|nr:hypothetical protein BTE48_13620 [Oceanospirillum multiglobuliferum]